MEHDFVALEQGVHRVCPGGVVWRRGIGGDGMEDGKWGLKMGAGLGVGRWAMGGGNGSSRAEEARVKPREACETEFSRESEKWSRSLLSYTA